MNGARRLTSLCFPAFLVASLTAAAAAPQIDSVAADAALTTVTINGSNFAASPPRTVFLSGFASPLVVSSITNTRIVASLPAGLAPGSYAVRVQGQGNGNFDEFYATFAAAPSGSGCTSYSNAASSGAFAAQVTVLQGGAYALGAKLVVNAFGGPANLHCTLNQVGPYLLIDDTFANGSGEINVILQGTATAPATSTYQASCTTTAGGAVTYYNWKIQALCLQALVSPSP